MAHFHIDLYRMESEYVCVPVNERMRAREREILAPFHTELH